MYLFVNTYVHVVDRMCVTIHTRNEKKNRRRSFALARFYIRTHFQFPPISALRCFITRIMMIIMVYPLFLLFLLLLFCEPNCEKIFFSLRNFLRRNVVQEIEARRHREVSLYIIKA